MNQEALNIAVKAVQIYAEHHPRPSQVTQQQAATRPCIAAAPCDVTMRYIECDPRILRQMFSDVIYGASPGR